MWIRRRGRIIPSIRISGSRLVRWTSPGPRIRDPADARPDTSRPPGYAGDERMPVSNMRRGPGSAARVSGILPCHHCRLPTT
jgi:hypothetical protein